MITIETRNGVRYFVFHDPETGLHTEAPVGGFGALFADEIELLRGQVKDREEAARWLYGCCTGTLTWKDVHTNEHPAIRWPWLEPKSVKVEGGDWCEPCNHDYKQASIEAESEDQI